MCRVRYSRRLLLLSLIGLLPLRVTPLESADFVRGDVDGSGGPLDLADALQVIGFMFLASPASLPCLDAADANDSGRVDIADGIYVLDFLFLGGMPPPPPFPACGTDPTGDELSCVDSTPCGGPPPVTFSDVSQPQGPVTGSYLRMRHPLFLLDRCREVKAGRLDRQEVESFVGPNALDALLGMDLEALLQKLTAQLRGPHDPGQPGGGNSLWYQILTNGGTAPLPALDFPEALDFQEVKALDSPQRTLRVTSPADGFVEARLPSGSPFQILSMQSYDGAILELPGAPGLPDAQPDQDSETQFSLGTETARTEAPWMVPVRAGQDVDVTIGLPEGTAIPPGGISSMLTVGDPSQTLWHADVRTHAEAPITKDNDIYISVNTPSRTFFFVQEPVFNPNSTFTYFFPLTMSTPNPAVTVQGTVKPVSLPQGVSISPPSSSFTLQPQGSVTLWLTLSIDRSSQAWLTTEVAQKFSVKVSYQTVPPLSASSDLESFVFFVYPSSQHWLAYGSSGGVNCGQWVVLLSDGTLTRSGDCDNRNAYTANVLSEGTLVVPKVVYDIYSMGWFDQDFKSSTVSWSYGQTNYINVRKQPLVMSWTKY
jgi:hypothetical protein